MSSYSEAIREAYATCPSNVAELHTLEISHPSIAETIYLVQNNEDLLLRLETGAWVTFEAAAFELVLPEKSDEGIQEINIKIANIDRRVSDFLNQASNFVTKVVCKYRPYLSNDLSIPQMNPPLMLTLNDVSVTTYDVTARASFADLVNRAFPKELYSRTVFPSLGG